MSAVKKFSKGGSSAFLKTLKSSRRSERRSAVAELVPVMLEIETSPKTMDELASKFPLAKRIVYSLISDGMIHEDKADSGEMIFLLTERGKEFLERRSLYG